MNVLAQEQGQSYKINFFRLSVCGAVTRFRHEICQYDVTMTYFLTKNVL